MRTFLLSSLLLVIIGSQRLLAQADAMAWELKTQEDNIKVYTRSTERSAVNEVRITATFHVNLEVFMKSLNDVANYDEWVYKGVNPKHIEAVNDDEFYYYIQSDFPYPLSDRDLVVRSRQWKDHRTNTYHSHSVAAPDKHRRRKGIVRIELYESFWHIQQNNDGTLAIDYKVIVDPGGNLPAWLINMAVTEGPLKTMKSLEAFAIKNAQLAKKR